MPSTVGHIQEGRSTAPTSTQRIAEAHRTLASQSGMLLQWHTLSNAIGGLRMYYINRFLVCQGRHIWVQSAGKSRNNSSQGLPKKSKQSGADVSRLRKYLKSA
uniref:Uncharacterized protein n=1 Tax=Eutreptiella gymnastica TaxID=73025 RepID=A0A7S1IDF1_9EUGL|mmetsp:Transcript_148919/g.260198  ORF Transcript_148919/g.260198 Transcript_148919/m.260198 type:complete len:103 (+) Transcript_148919:64-372(+)